MLQHLTAYNACIGSIKTDTSSENVWYDYGGLSLYTSPGAKDEVKLEVELLYPTY